MIWYHVRWYGSMRIFMIWFPWYVYIWVCLQMEKNSPNGQLMWATVTIWYIAPSHQFLKSVLSFFRFWYISKCYRFLKSVLSFSKPQLNFQKIETARILLSINLNFGCSSYTIHLHVRIDHVCVSVEYRTKTTGYVYVGIEYTVIYLPNPPHPLQPKQAQLTMVLNHLRFPGITLW